MRFLPSWTNTWNRWKQTVQQLSMCAASNPPSISPWRQHVRFSALEIQCEDLCLSIGYWWERSGWTPTVGSQTAANTGPQQSRHGWIQYTKMHFLEDSFECMFFYIFLAGFTYSVETVVRRSRKWFPSEVSFIFMTTHKHLIKHKNLQSSYGHYF